jgi:hypothetical protein
MTKRLVWKTFSVSLDDVRHLRSAWASSKAAFGKGKVMHFGPSGASGEVETNISISGLRTLLRHAGARIIGGFDNGIVWDDKPLDERDDEPDPAKWRS